MPENSMILRKLSTHWQVKRYTSIILGSLEFKKYHKRSTDFDEIVVNVEKKVLPNAAQVIILIPHCGSNSAVECFLAKEDVVSSNLISRSTSAPGQTIRGFCL
jgi:hypothetical protein